MSTECSPESLHFQEALGRKVVARFDGGTLGRISAGRIAGSDVGVNATPTVLVNGWRIGTPPGDEELEAMVRRVSAGMDPIERE